MQKIYQFSIVIISSTYFTNFIFSQTKIIPLHDTDIPIDGASDEAV
jgi:hypothetical protein